MLQNLIETHKIGKRQERRRTKHKEPALFPAPCPPPILGAQNSLQIFNWALNVWRSQDSSTGTGGKYHAPSSPWPDSSLRRVAAWGVEGGKIIHSKLCIISFRFHYRNQSW